MAIIKSQAVYDRGYRMMPWWKRLLHDFGFTVYNDFDVELHGPNPGITLYEP